MKHIHPSLLALAIVVSAGTSQAQPPASPARLDQVAERGGHVMPFALDKTLHVFEKTEHGGLQQVIAKDANDAEQISLIRQHLADISAGFRNGDFSRQRRIHGDDMPGLAELAAAAGAVRFDYRELPNGAEIEYSAEQPALVDAIHRFFGAQLSDHARHAVGGQAMKCEHDGHAGDAGRMRDTRHGHRGRNAQSTHPQE
ncbi:aspartate carbamoyltransferase [Methylomonas sp. MED-D]|uniref:aspartate carbamoyltransferase n=1 Tax=Methylomonas sp. MED-D TaxID=3418768 RepID=UPI003D01DBC8